MFLLICYDIVCNRRRRQIEKLLSAHGKRVQKSVFEAHLTEKKRLSLDAKLRRRMDESEDNIRYYRLCEKCVRSVETRGVGPPRLEERDIIVV